jgi:hypothetical protein
MAANGDAGKAIVVLQRHSATFLRSHSSSIPAALVSVVVWTHKPAAMLTNTSWTLHADLRFVVTL